MFKKSLNMVPLEESNSYFTILFSSRLGLLVALLTLHYNTFTLFIVKVLKDTESVFMQVRE